ncbi:Na+/H+-dicarboxylate symporter [Sphingomonas guangdongensis]|uniref:Na+/H+-dicarboxylate symporter n=1 Tax=Sphingomonas guangdongensis TaxID=1141890 RepID=A0A285R221_9SPHN|nr:cation:dicarboxylase symporter family transporter [Sphingomonas guangdongensis]SOB86392.1 Na+/H+-dicarboxylate symporter [Sphingomonas guangdongensis]
MTARIVSRVPASVRVLIALLAGLVGGYLAGPDAPVLPILQPIGGLWLDALRMPIIPLVFALIVTGIAGGAAEGGSTAVARRAIATFALFLSLSALFGVTLGSAMFGGWKVAGLEEVRAGAGTVPALPPTGEVLRQLLPANPIAAAAGGAIVSVVIFALFLALALRRIDPARAAAVTGVLRGLADALLVIIGWVLLLAPIGVFALAFDVAARSGLAVGTVLAWYVAARVIGGVVLLSAFVVLVAMTRRVRLGAFLRAAVPAQSVAFSTQSSLAALPAMLAGSARLGLDERQSGTVLPLAVALFRISAPTAISLAVLALARLNGIELGVAQLALVAVLAVVNNLVIAGLPNQISFFAAYAPVAIAVGVPVELLPLFLAVDTVPDMAATTANVTADLAVTTLLAERKVPELAERAV